MHVLKIASYVWRIVDYSNIRCACPRGLINNSMRIIRIYRHTGRYGGPKNINRSIDAWRPYPCAQAHSPSPIGLAPCTYTGNELRFRSLYIIYIPTICIYRSTRSSLYAHARRDIGIHRSVRGVPRYAIDIDWKQTAPPYTGSLHV